MTDLQDFSWSKHLLGKDTARQKKVNNILNKPFPCRKLVVNFYFMGIFTLKAHYKKCLATTETLFLGAKKSQIAVSTLSCKTKNPF